MLYLELFSKPILKLQPGNIETFGLKNVLGKGTEIYGWTDRITNQHIFTFTVVYLYIYLSDMEGGEGGGVETRMPFEYIPHRIREGR